jgi:hypothetical protein
MAYRDPPLADVGRRRPAQNRGAIHIAVIIGAALLAALLALFFFRLVTLERHVGYFAPAFSPDGKSVVVVERRTRGISWGLGWEFFTPPAYARGLSDELRLMRVSLDGSKVEILERWSSTPVVGRTLQQYRGRLFNHLGASLRPQANGSIGYGFELALPRVPTSEVHQLHGMWSLDSSQRQRGEWDRSAGKVVAGSEPVILGERELFALRGPEAFPSAIALLDHATKQIRVVISAPVYESIYPNGPMLDELMQVSRKADHDRVQAITRIQREREALYQSQGMLPGAAILRANRDLRDLGYFGKPPRWIARRLTAADVAAASSTPRFDVDEMEFKVGLMQDIAKAIAQPGVEIDWDGGRYITHRDYPNAGKLNGALEKGATEIVVGYRGDAYLLTLLPRTEAEKK